MTINKAPITHILTVAFVIASVLFSISAQAGEKGSDEMRSLLTQRVVGFCRPLAGEWLISQNGMNDSGIKTRAVDCWISNSRLLILGYESGLDIASGTSISELPARILESKAGISFDPYQPLAGRALEFPTALNGVK